ncbi:MAG: FMN-binding protein [Candidatus Pacebacteria bacterium]|jgi:uncharacterized protein with FMN-binding domain|nr:FMN-binding protein [Candidatus Paceibacterota bacterium]
MASFQKNLQKFFVYFFTGISVIIVVLGIQRVKHSDTLGTTAAPDEGETGKIANGTTPSKTRVAGAQETISANGKTFQTPWGNLSTLIKVQNGKIVSVEIPQLPDSPPSLEAKNYLIDQVLRSGDANIQGVSGATITSRAFKASLESALALAATQGGTTTTNTAAATTATTATNTGASTPAPAAATTVAQTTTNTTGVSGTFTGNAYQTPWGNAVASVTFTNGKITAVTMPQVPNSPPSVQAKQYLIDQALAAGSANIQGVSGATYASIAFKSSLESAISKASAQGTVSAPTPSAVGTATQQPAKPSISRTYRDDDEYEDEGHDDERDEWDDDDEWDD